MPARIVITPVAISEGPRGSIIRVPLVSTIVDPGRPPTETEDDDGNPITVPKTLVHVSAISSGQPGERNEDCMSIVAGVDMSNLDAQANIVTLFESGTDRPLADLRRWLTNTPGGLGWSNARQNRLRNRLISYGADVAGLTGDTPLWQIVNRLGRVWEPTFDVRQVTTSAPGA